MKRCAACGEEKPLEEFHKRSVSSDGHDRQCRPCRCADRRDRYQRDRKKHAAAALARRRANPEAAIAALARWRENHRDEIRAKRAREREEAPEVWAAQQLRYREGYREQARENSRQWRKRNPEKRRAEKHIRRAREMRAYVEDVDFRAAYDRDDGLCGICGRPVAWERAEMDHFIPLARGGAHATYNIQPAHGPCNRSKGATLPTAEEVERFETRVMARA